MSLQEDNARQTEPLPGGTKFRAAVLSMDGTLITTRDRTLGRGDPPQDALTKIIIIKQWIHVDLVVLLLLLTG